MNIHSASDIPAVFERIKEQQEKHRFIRVLIKVGPDRSAEQNRMYYKIYGMIGDQLYGGDINHAKAECKLHYGVPILRAEDEDYCSVYDKSVKQFPYEQKLAFMLPPFEFPVTSKFTVKQSTKYIDLLLNTYANKGVDFSEIDK